MRKHVRLGFSLAIAATLAISGPVSAHDPSGDGGTDSAQGVHGRAHAQHGTTAGHLIQSPTSSNVDLIGKLRVQDAAEGKIADVGIWHGFAYLGSFVQDTCTNPENTIDGGVYVIDIGGGHSGGSPSNPVEIGFIRAHQDTFVGEGVQVIRVDTAKFHGDLLLQNNEGCDVNDKGGVSLFDVTDPYQPKPLIENWGDFNVKLGGSGKQANDIHSVFGWQAGSKAYAVLVDDLETTDVDIADITDPAHPRMIREYDLNAEMPQIIQPELGSGSSFFHDVVVKKIGARYEMLLSYWDGGYVKLDVTDPANATYIADSDFTNPDPEVLAQTGVATLPEGNAHESEFTLDSDFIVAADEDFSPFSAFVFTDDGGSIKASGGSNTPPVPPSGLTGDAVFVGRACTSLGDPTVPAGDGTQIAVVERGVCTFTEKVAAVEAAGGYVGIVIFNREGADACSGGFGMTVSGGLPTMSVPRPFGFGIFDQEADYNEAECVAQAAGARTAPIDIGKIGDELTISSIFDGWGYVHLFRNGSGKLAELDTFAIDEAMDPAFASGFGDLSVHEVATSHVDNTLAYLSYYSAGFRVLRIVDDELSEVGYYTDANGNNFWGVQVFDWNGHEYVAASDRDSGLWIFEYTGP
jgi:PA domain